MALALIQLRIASSCTVSPGQPLNPCSLIAVNMRVCASPMIRGQWRGSYASAMVEARSKRIHVTAHVVEATFTGHPDNIQLGDQHITSVELRDKNGMPVGTDAGVCTIVNTTTEPREQCLITAVFTNGQIIFGGLDPLLEVEAVGHFAILGGTDDFRKKGTLVERMSWHDL